MQMTPQVQSVKPRWFLFSVIAGVIAAICLGIWIFTLNSRPTDFVPGKATISDIVTTEVGYDYETGIQYNHEAYVDYTYLEQDYTHQSIDYYDGTWKVGDVIDVLINPNNPSDVRASDISGFTTFLLIAWITLLAIAATFTGIGIYQRIKAKNPQPIKTN